MCWLKRIDKTPEGEELDKAKLKRLMKQANNPNGPCHALSLRQCYHYQKKGIPYMLIMGEWNGERHNWVEYWKDGKWLVDDRAKSIRGWERDKVKQYSKYTVQTVPDFRKGA